MTFNVLNHFPGVPRRMNCDGMLAIAQVCRSRCLGRWTQTGDSPKYRRAPNVNRISNASFTFRREVGLGSECNKRNCALMSYLWLHPRGSDPIVVGTHPHLIEAGTFQVRLDLLRG